MRVEDLESFLAICDTGTFSRAAKQRSISQPGVTRHIQRLELALGAILVERTRPNVVLTKAGETLKTYAQDSSRRYQILLSDIRQEGSVMSGELRIAASTTPGEYILPKSLADFTEVHPLVRPQVFIGDSLAVTSEVLERRWELGFVGVRPTNRSLEYELAGEDELVLVVPERHPFARRKSVALYELEDQPFIEREGGSGTMRHFRAVISHAGLKIPVYKVTMVVNSTHSILLAAQNGFGLGLISSLAFEQHSFNHVFKVPITGVKLSRAIYMIHEKQRPISLIASAFRDWIRNYKNAGEKISEPQLNKER
jgi:DNA-binding transcriptional LysR family regulator